MEAKKTLQDFDKKKIKKLNKTDFRYPLLLAECAPQAAKYGKCVGDVLGMESFVWV